MFLTGPTASGKSAVALELARRLDGEIISVDSMQVYRGLDIGTAKPGSADRELVPHHLIDIIDLGDSFDAARFVERAREAVREIQERNRAPIFCGGTGLYLKAYLEGLGWAPPSDPALRKELEEARLADLLDELRNKDPVTFDRIDRQNSRRVIRAVEVLRLTGRPFSEQQALWNRPAAENVTQSSNLPAALIIGLVRQPADLRQRIDLRVESMFRAGLVNETQHLLAAGLGENRTALQAIGYRQVVEHLRGQRSLRETIELVKTKTRQYAKRQLTWLRHQLPVVWLPVENSETPDLIAERALDLTLQG